MLAQSSSAPCLCHVLLAVWACHPAAIAERLALPMAPLRPGFVWDRRWCGDGRQCTARSPGTSLGTDLAWHYASAWDSSWESGLHCDFAYHIDAFPTPGVQVGLPELPPAASAHVAREHWRICPFPSLRLWISKRSFSALRPS